MAANRRLARMLGKEFGVTFKQYQCGMHSAKNSTEYYEQMLMIASKSTQHAKMLFGTRMIAANSKHSLRNELEIALALETERRFSPFRTDIGARLGVGYANARGLIELRDVVLKVVSIAKERTNPYARELRDMLTVGWNQTLNELGAYAVHWIVVVNPYFTLLGKLTTNLGLAKTAARRLEDMNRQMTESDESFDVLLGFITSDVLDKHPYLTIVKQHWQTSDAATKNQVNETVKQAALRARKKIVKDTKLLLEIDGPHDQLLPFSNNFCESSFSHIKELHKKFPVMEKDSKAQIGQARQNHLHQWILQQSDEDLDQVLCQVEREWRVNQKVKKRMKALQNRHFYDILFEIDE